MAVAAEQKTTEPSMEEILASIRRIISDDQQPAPSASPVVEAPKPASQQPGQPIVVASRPQVAVQQPASMPVIQSAVVSASELEEDVLELTVTAVAPMIEVQSNDEVEKKIVPIPEPVSTKSSTSTFEKSIMPEPLIAGQTDKFVSNAFGTLANTVLSQNPRSLDNIVKDMLHSMLHPMLKSWLDSNLPTIVENLVRAEIERVARGGR